jgi:polyhydroxybutyrate depolymerase
LSPDFLKTKLAVGLLLVCGISSSSRAQTLAKYTTTWHGIKRYYAVYTPKAFDSNPAMVLFLHSTSQNLPNNPPYYAMQPWKALANQQGFLMVWPISSYNPATKQWYWECYETDTTFKIAPDDSGFLRWLITSLQSRYGISAESTFVTGMSSGAFMAHRVGSDSSDIVAAIAPVSGMIDIHPIGQNYSPPLPARPVSIFELHGDEDTVVPYCGGTGWFWGALHDTLPSIDDTVDFWIAANACTERSTSQTLCTNGQPTQDVVSQDATGCVGGTEVVFQREVGLGHVWPAGTETKVWEFFQNHRRP